MSLSVPSRRLLRGAPALATTPTTTTSLVPALHSLTLTPTKPTTPARGMHTTPTNQWFWSRDKKTEAQAPASPIEKQVSGTQAARQQLLKALNNKPLEGPAIFEDELKETADKTGTETEEYESRRTKTGLSLAREHLSRATDPDPRARVRWERKMVIRQLQRGTDPFSREPRAARIARTEREQTTRSPFMATSTKKLVHLARQIQGKTVSEALVQMRFSKKKYAQEVRYHLEEARDLALVQRGMGLGSAKKKADGSSGGSGGGGSDKPVEIQTKDGKWIKVDDPTRMYVAEAWVNRGPWRGKIPEYRARGRMNIRKLPSAGISVVLKEEKTRIREAAEREAKKLRHGPWVHLPNRPVTAQRQWYSW
ncbi:ribosomal protein L22/L17 [Chaetomium fimeti]|uniref:Ribosomal protein L22/L17 n=1 Tax=Chaetomium fimeti TaxID=1854472 RepID=A0AAE0LNU6_9PEZI|nr:ribosomal protein L22/L17 [Chaetomium fimeti]